MKNLKAVLLGCFALLFLCVFQVRYLSPKAGIYTTSIDYGVHLNISEHLRTGNIFPGNEADTGQHAVSKYLPIYHGLLGFHLLTLILETTGIPLPGAYALVMDLSIAAMLLVFLFLLIDRYRKEQIFETILAVSVAFPIFAIYFTQAVKDTFFAQLLSQALISLSVYLFIRGHKKSAAALLAYATFCYPDFLIWFIPLLFFAKEKPLKIAGALLAPFWLILAYVPFSRSALTGPLSSSPIVYMATCALILVYIKSLWKNHRALAIIALSFLAYSLILTLTTMKYLTPSYYAAKISSFSYLLLIYILTVVPVLSKFLGKLIVGIMILLLSSDQTLKTQISADYFITPQNFTNSDYLSARQMISEIKTKTSCLQTTTYQLPAHSNMGISVTAFNGLLMNFNIYSLDLNSKALNQAFAHKNGSMGNFIRTLSDQSTGWLTPFQSALNKNITPDFCLAVPKSTATLFAENQNFENIYEGAHFVYFKPKKP